MATALTMAKTSVGVYNMLNGGALTSSSVSAKNKALSSLSSTYGNTGSYFTSSATSRALSNSYTAAKKEFVENYESSTTALKKSLEKLKTADYSGDAKTLTETVKSFVSSYNETVDLLSDVKSTSSRAQGVLNLFSTATSQGALASIGITTSTKDGTLKLNEKSFEAALSKDPSKVADVLAGSRTGVADKLTSQVDFAKTQADKLYPAASTAIGVSTGLSNSYLNNAVYNNAGAMTRVSAYQNVGTLLNMFF